MRQYFKENWIELFILFSLGMCAGVMYMLHSPVENKLRGLQSQLSTQEQHTDTLAKMLQQEQYQIDVITQYIKEKK